MGAVYVLICIVLGLIAFLPFMDELSQSVQTATTSNDFLPLLDAIRAPMIIFAVLYVLMASIFWYAPALAGFHNVTLLQALFFSGIKKKLANQTFKNNRTLCELNCAMIGEIFVIPTCLETDILLP